MWVDAAPRSNTLVTPRLSSAFRIGCIEQLACQFRSLGVPMFLGIENGKRQPDKLVIKDGVGKRQRKIIARRAGRTRAKVQLG